MGFYICISIAAYIFGGATLATFLQVRHAKRPMTPQEGSTIVGGVFGTVLFLAFAYVFRSETNPKVTASLIVGLGLFGFFMGLMKK